MREGWFLDANAVVSAGEYDETKAIPNVTSSDDRTDHDQAEAGEADARDVAVAAMMLAAAPADVDRVNRDLTPRERSEMLALNGHARRPDPSDRHYGGIFTCAASSPCSPHLPLS